jgi:hypothetical protein
MFSVAQEASSRERLANALTLAGKVLDTGIISDIPGLQAGAKIAAEEITDFFQKPSMYVYCSKSESN